MAISNNNLTGLAVITNTNGLVALPQNFIDNYDYVTNYQPELVKEMVYKHGKGSLLGFIRATRGKIGTYEGDEVKHKEMGRYMNFFDGVTLAGNNFTFPAAHNLRIGEVVRLSDGTGIWQGKVTALVSATVATILNDSTTAYPVGPFSVEADFSSRFLKGADGFVSGKTWEPETKTSYSHIMDNYADVADSDLAHKFWVNTDHGPAWFNTTTMILSMVHDNIIEKTMISHERVQAGSDSASAGDALGLDGLIPQTAKYGNVFPGPLTTLADLKDFAWRAKQQGSCREFIIGCNHDQLDKVNTIGASLNSGFVNGGWYGAFNNEKDMALKLDFNSFSLLGVTFHFMPMEILDDVTGAGGTNFIDSGVSFVGIPTGSTAITENGEKTKKPYFEPMFRKSPLVDRAKQYKWFGVLGTAIHADKSYVKITTEGTLRLAGANNFFVGGAAYTGV
tara:strand:- start:10542 stop:11888 length:1347 start_codon:yes stop_codon:yes gene_type:complete